MITRESDWISFFFVDHIIATTVTAGLTMAAVVMAIVLTVAATVVSHSDDIGQGIGHFARQVSDGYHKNQHK